MKNKGFTLLEIIIVIVIIGVLTTLALPKLFTMIEASRATEAMATISSIRMAMQRYCLMNGTCRPPNIAYGLLMDKSQGVNLLGIDFPEDSPGAHFSYQVSAGALGSMHYIIVAKRNSLNTDRYKDHVIIFCVGCRPYVYPDGKGSSFPWHSPNNETMAWDAASIYKGVIPK